MFVLLFRNNDKKNPIIFKLEMYQNVTQTNLKFADLFI